MQIKDDTDSQGNVIEERGPFVPTSATDLAKHRSDLERILNVDMLSTPPYSLVNLTENLLPLNLTSTVADLVDLANLYRGSTGATEILELTLKNL